MISQQSGTKDPEAIDRSIHRDDWRLKLVHEQSGGVVADVRIRFSEIRANNNYSNFGWLSRDNSMLKGKQYY